MIIYTVLLLGAMLFVSGRLLLTRIPDDAEASQPHCPKCGYNLSGGSSYICPDCGASWCHETAEFSKRPPHLAWAAGLLLCGIGGILLLVGMSFVVCRP